jgi:hypothetical protein
MESLFEGDSSQSPAQLPEHAEPIEAVLARRFKVTLALTVIPSIIGLNMLLIFASFGRPDIGLIVVGLLFLPVVVLAWREYLVLRSRLRTELAGSLSDQNNDALPD